MHFYYLLRSYMRYIWILLLSGMCCCAGQHDSNEKWIQITQGESGQRVFKNIKNNTYFAKNGVQVSESTPREKGNTSIDCCVIPADARCSQSLLEFHNYPYTCGYTSRRYGINSIVLSRVFYCSNADPLRFLGFFITLRGNGRAVEDNWPAFVQNTLQLNEKHCKPITGFTIQRGGKKNQNAMTNY